MRKIAFVVPILIVGALLGVVAILLFSKMQDASSLSGNASSITILDQTSQKKADLASYFGQISSALETKNWDFYYDLMRSDDFKQNVTKEQHAEKMNTSLSNAKTVAIKVEVGDILVDGDKGTVERTIVTCKTLECNNESRHEIKGKSEFAYRDGKWIVANKVPSERALKVAAFVYANESTADQKEFLDRWSFGSNKSDFATRQYALDLDSDLTQLVSEEANIEKYKIDLANRPKVIYQQTPVYVQQPAPVIDTSPNHTRCTSNRIGDSVYTNCYDY